MFSRTPATEIVAGLREFAEELLVET